MNPSLHPFHLLSSLRRAPGPTGKAPHKPILLLAVLELISQGRIRDNRIEISPELIAAFKNIWLRLVHTEAWQPRFYLPFYHLSGDGFWKLELYDGAKLALTASYSPKSVPSLQNSIAYAHVLPALWEAMVEPVQRMQMRAFMLKQYFDGHDYRQDTLEQETEHMLRQLELDFEGHVAAEPPSKYFKTVETEARCAVFKSRVPKLYNYTCAISGLQVTSTNQAQLVDACHILPWSSSKDDTIQNGICLTPTLHRAFDRGLLGIDAEYKVVLAEGFVEAEGSPYRLGQFCGKRIHLPREEKWWPDAERLRERMQQMGK